MLFLKDNLVESRVLRGASKQTRSVRTATCIVPRPGGRLFGYIWGTTRGIRTSAECYLSISGGELVAEKSGKRTR
jgi:hypothetical protein